MAIKTSILLTAEQISICRGVIPVLSQLDITLGTGQALVITGSNGSGKSTLLRALAGLLPLDHGRIAFDGIDIKSDPHHLLEHAVYIGHKDGLSGALTASENIHLWGMTHGMDFDRDLLEDAFADLGMADFMETEVRRLSEGQRRRCGLVRLALSHRCGQRKKLWLLDEPLTAIDTKAATRFCRLIDHHTDMGGSAIISTHSHIAVARKTAFDLTPHSLTAELMGQDYD